MRTISGETTSQVLGIGPRAEMGPHSAGSRRYGSLHPYLVGQ